MVQILFDGRRRVVVQTICFSGTRGIKFKIRRHLDKLLALHARSWYRYFSTDAEELLCRQSASVAQEGSNLRFVDTWINCLRCTPGHGTDTFRRTQKCCCADNLLQWHKRD